MTEKRYKVPIPVSLDDVYAYQEKKLVESGIKIDGIPEIRLSALIFQNPNSKKSVSVHYLQQKLSELGHSTSLADKDGWLSEGTKAAIMEFQSANSLPMTGSVDKDTLLAIFKDDNSVQVVID